VSSFTDGVNCFLRGFGLMFRPGIRRWSIPPVLLSALLYGLLFWWASGYAEDAARQVEDALPSWLSWLSALVWLLFWIAAFLLMTFTFVVIAGVVASPFNGPLAEATERLLSGRGPPPSTLGRTLILLPRTLMQELKKLLYALVFSVPFLILFLIPVVNLAAPILWFLWGAWVAALAYTDYAMDNNGMLFHEMRRLLGRHRSAALGFGSVAVVVFSVPVLNFLAVPAAVCGGAVLWTEKLRPEPPRHQT